MKQEKSKSVLIVSGGGFQGLTLIKLFQELEKFIIHVADINEESVGRYFTDYYTISPPISKTKNFKNFILQYIEDNSIDYVIPSTVYELHVLASIKNKVKSVVLVSSAEALETFLDKKLTLEALDSHGFNTLPVISAPVAEDFPLLMKPRLGFGGKGVKIIKSKTHLDESIDFDEFILQPYITSFKEYSIDIFLGNTLEQTVYETRRRLQTSGGFAVVSELVDDRKLSELAEKLAHFLTKVGALGFYNVQTLETDSGMYVNDINPRIGTSASFIPRKLNQLSQFFQGASSDSEKVSEKKIVRYLYEKIFDKIDLSNITSICFDLDDTLINHRSWIEERIDILCEKLDLSKEQSGEVQMLSSAILYEGKADRLIDILSEKMDEILPPKMELLSLYRTCWPEQLKLLKGAERVIDYFYSKGYRLSILTDNPIQTQMKKINLLPFKEKFESIHFSQSAGYEKPAKECFDLTLKGKGLTDLDQMIFVGDNFYRDIAGSLDFGYNHAFLYEHDNGIRGRQSINSKMKRKYLNYSTIADLTDLIKYFP